MTPDWLKALTGDNGGKQPPPNEPPQAAGDGETTPAAQRALDGISKRLTDAVEGTRNGLLNWAAYRAGQYHAAGCLSAEDARTAIYTAAYACGLTEPEVTQTFTSGWDSGNQSPQAPLDRHHTPTLSPYTATPTDQDNPDGPQLPQPLDWHELWADETEDEWILEPLIPARRLIALYSAPKAGKSLLMLELAAAIASGREALGRPAQPPRTVLYVDYENDPRGDVRTRLQDLGYTPQDLDQLRYLSYPVLGGLDTYAGAAVLIAVVDEQDPELVIIDTVSRAVAGEENENDTWLNFYRQAGLALKQRGIACVRLDHSGKDTTKGQRGGSAKSGDVDAIWQLRKISEETVTLHCDDARLVITERDLTLKRNTNPLRHNVQADAAAASSDAITDAIIADIERLGLPLELGNRAVGDALREAGLGGPGRGQPKIDWANKQRKQRAGITVLGESE